MNQNVLGFEYISSSAIFWFKSWIFTFLDSPSVDFQVQALISNHAQEKLGDQGILSNRTVLVQNCTVKCFDGILLFKHG